MAAKKAARARKASQPEPVPLEDNVGVRIVRLAEVFARLAKLGVERPWGLRSTDLRILNVLDGSDSVAISEIARRTHVDKAWISRSVNRLVDSGLVRRVAADGDSRLSLVRLTARGRALLADIRPHVERAEQHVLDGIKAERFKRDLDRLLANAEAILAQRQ